MLKTINYSFANIHTSNFPVLFALHARADCLSSSVFPNIYFSLLFLLIFNYLLDFTPLRPGFYLCVFEAHLIPFVLHFYFLSITVLIYKRFKLSAYRHIYRICMYKMTGLAMQMLCTLLKCLAFFFFFLFYLDFQYQKLMKNIENRSCWYIKHKIVESLIKEWQSNTKEWILYSSSNIQKIQPSWWITSQNFILTFLIFLSSPWLCNM